MCHSREAAQQIKAQLAEWLAPRGLVFNEDKTRIVHAEAGFDVKSASVLCRAHGSSPAPVGPFAGGVLVLQPSTGSPAVLPAGIMGWVSVAAPKPVFHGSPFGLRRSAVHRWRSYYSDKSVASRQRSRSRT
jgi:hypothetical protein